MQPCLRCRGNSSLRVIVSRVLSHQRFLSKQALTCHVQLSHMETLQLQLSSRCEYSCYKLLGISQATYTQTVLLCAHKSGSRQESLCVGLLEQLSSTGVATLPGTMHSRRTDQVIELNLKGWKKSLRSSSTAINPSPL